MAAVYRVPAAPSQCDNSDAAASASACIPLVRRHLYCLLRPKCPPLPRYYKTLPYGLEDVSLPVTYTTYMPYIRSTKQLTYGHTFDDAGTTRRCPTGSRSSSSTARGCTSRRPSMRETAAARSSRCLLPFYPGSCALLRLRHPP